MKLDILKKLTRLANNNPNDNEANLAARRVCKILEECNWILKDDVSNNTDYTRINNPYNPFEDFEKNFWTNFYGGKTWTHSNPPPKDEYKEDNKTHRERYNEYRENEEKYKEKNTYIYDSIFGKDRKAKKDTKRILKCKVCGKNSETSFVGAPEVYECGPCQWNAYLRDKMKSEW